MKQLQYNYAAGQIHGSSSTSQYAIHFFSACIVTGSPWCRSSFPHHSVSSLTEGTILTALSTPVLKEVVSNRASFISEWAAAGFEQMSLVSGQTSWETWPLSERWDWDEGGWSPDLLPQQETMMPALLSGHCGRPLPWDMWGPRFEAWAPIPYLAFNIWSQGWHHTHLWQTWLLPHGVSLYGTPDWWKLCEFKIYPLLPFCFFMHWLVSQVNIRCSQ